MNIKTHSCGWLHHENDNFCGGCGAKLKDPACWECGALDGAEHERGCKRLVAKGLMCAKCGGPAIMGGVVQNEAKDGVVRVCETCWPSVITQQQHDALLKAAKRINELTNSCLPTAMQEAMADDFIKNHIDLRKLTRTLFEHGFVAQQIGKGNDLWLRVGDKFTDNGKQYVIAGFGGGGGVVAAFQSHGQCKVCHQDVYDVYGVNPIYVGDFFGMNKGPVHDNCVPATCNCNEAVPPYEVGTVSRCGMCGGWRGVEAATIKPGDEIAPGVVARPAHYPTKEECARGFIPVPIPQPEIEGVNVFTRKNFTPSQYVQVADPPEYLCDKCHKVCSREEATICTGSVPGTTVTVCRSCADLPQPELVQKHGGQL